MSCAAATHPTQYGSEKVRGKILYLLLCRLLALIPKITEQYLNLEVVSRFPTTTKYSWLELLNNGRISRF